jgi:molecular chaperone DnaK
VDNQTNVEILVLQGERELTKDNKSLGTFLLDGIPLAPRSVPQIEVTFDIDVNGILSVKAKDKGTGKEQSITIKDASSLDKTEVERLVQEAEASAQQDKSKREQIDLKNQADLLAYQAEKEISNLDDKIDSITKQKLEEAIQDLRLVIQNDEFDSIKLKMHNLEQILEEISHLLYKTSKQTTVNSNESDNSLQNDDTVIDTNLTD